MTDHAQGAFTGTCFGCKAWIENGKGHSPTCTVAHALGLPPQTSADRSAKAYVLWMISSFDGDPPDNAFQRGYLAALEVVRDKAFASELDVRGDRQADDTARLHPLGPRNEGASLPEGERENPTLYDRAIASRLAWREQAESLAALLIRCRTVLGNMAMENEGAIFNRWPINHEPLRADAKGLVPLLDEALSGHHKAFMASLSSTLPSTDRGSAA